MQYPILFRIIDQIYDRMLQSNQRPLDALNLGSGRDEIGRQFPIIIRIFARPIAMRSSGRYTVTAQGMLSEAKRPRRIES